MRSPEGFRLNHLAGNQSLFYRNSSVRLVEISDGSGTLLAGDANGSYIPTGCPYGWRDVSLGLRTSSAGFGSTARDDTHLLMCDGSVKVLARDVDSAVFSAMAGPAELLAVEAQIAKDDPLYGPIPTTYWRFDIDIVGHKTLVKFRLSPDGTELLADLVPCEEDYQRTGGQICWETTARGLADFNKLRVVRIRGMVDACDLLPFLKAPGLVTLDLTRTRIRGNLADILSEARPELEVERWPSDSN